MVEELAIEQQDIVQVCRVLKVSRSGYYGWRNRPASIRKTEDERLWLKIKQHWEASRNAYGRIRITAKLQEDGEKIGKNRVSRIMSEHGIKGKGRKKFKPLTTDSNHNFPLAERLFQTENATTQVRAVNQYWGGDITYIPTGEGWLYLSVVIDLFTKKVVGHAMRDHMRTELISSALDLAIKRQGIVNGKNLIFHSDRGSQYASDDYREKLKAFSIRPSMSRKGNCYDNAMVESFFRTLKVELIYDQTYRTKEEAKAAIFEFIEVWYNRQRLHSSLDYTTPEQYEIEHSSAA